MHRTAARRAAIALLLAGVLLAAQGQTPAASADPVAGPPATPAASPVASPASSPAAPSSPLEHYLRQDIESSSAAELGDRLRRLGLSDQGSLSELRQRLFQYYHLDAGPASSPAPVPNPSASPEAPPSTGGSSDLEISIETAGSAQYFTVEEVDENYLQLSGGVILNVNDPRRNTRHRIRADRIIYNRKSDVMIARGRVDYTLTEKGKDQVFQGSELRFSLSSMEVFILDGVLHNQHATGEKTLDYRIEGEEISRNDRNLVVLDQATVSSSKASPPSYRVRAGHIWLLNAGEWAIRDGVLHIGRVPLMWIPFFYYPNDEMVFHPVAGYQEPEGAYLQTTTYFAGKKAKTQAPFSFMQYGDGGGETDYVLHGLFLEPVSKSGTGSATPSGDKPSNTAGGAAAPAAPAQLSLFKMMADIYSRYGYLIGFQGKVSAAPVLNIDFMAAAGFSRALFKGPEGDVSTYRVQAGSDPREYWDSGFLFGGEVPFRFLANLQSTVRFEGFNAGLALPLSGDPGFNASFLAKRQEDINWAKLVGLTKTTASPPSTSSVSDTMNMSLTLSWTPAVTALQPFIDSFSLRNLDANLNWSAKTWTNPPDWVAQATQSAEKRFWTPELLTLPKTSLNLAGTLLQYPWPAPAGAVEKDGKKGSEEDVAAPGPDFLLPGAEYVAPSTAKPDAAPKDDHPAGPESGEAPRDTMVGDLDPPVPLGGAAGLKTTDWQFRLEYGLNPGLTINSRFAAADAVSPVGMVPSLSYWTLQDRLSGNLELHLSSPLSLFSIEDTLNFSGQDQSLLSLDSAAPANIAANINSETARARYLTIDNGGTIKLTPLQGTGLFDGSFLEYGLSTVLYRWKWESGLTPESAVYKTETFDWTKDLVTSHKTKLNLSFAAAPWSANLSGELVLPPLVQSINTHGDIRWDRLSFTADEVFNFSADLATLKPAPLKLVLSLPLADWFSTSHSLEINWDKNRVDNYSANLGLAGFTANLQARPAADQTFSVATRKWVASGPEYFRLVSGSLDYTLAWTPDPVWFNRIGTKLSLNGRWSQNFITVTDSLLNWNFGWEFKVAEFLDLNLTLGGQNNRVFRYVPAFNQVVGITDTRDFFMDLLNSFGLGWNAAIQALEASDAYRKSSYFKMSSISITAVHFLGDWQLSLSYKGLPTVQTNATTKLQEIAWSYNFTATVAWYPISEMQTTVKAYYDTTDQKQKLSIE